MIREELFDAWAPTGVPWSDWAKPVLFAHWRVGVRPDGWTVGAG